MLLGLLRVWRPKAVLGFGGRELSADEVSAYGEQAALAPGLAGGEPGTAQAGWLTGSPSMRVIRSLVPFVILIGVVVAWTGPWSPLNSVGAETGKPVAPQTTSVGVSTTKYVRREGEVIRYNMGWALMILLYLIAIGCLYYFWMPDAMQP
jgi:L-lactate permease